MAEDRHILNCRHQWPAPFRIQFEFECPKQWDLLEPTEHDHKRHCSACNQPVYRVINMVDARLRIEQGECISVPAWMAQRVEEAVERGEGLDDRLTITGRPTHPLIKQLEAIIDSEPSEHEF